MRDVDEGDTDLALDALELELHLFAELQVERPERFVEKEHAGPVDERPGEGHALLLTPGHLGDAPVSVPGEIDELEDLLDPLLGIVPGDLLALQPVGHVLRHVEVGEQRVRLEHGVDVPLVGRKAGNVVGAEEDLAGGGLFEPADHPERRGLAAARRAEEREELALFDLEVDVIDRDDVFERLGDPFEADGGHVRHHVIQPPPVPVWAHLNASTRTSSPASSSASGIPSGARSRITLS